mmetsp:Transcript_21112/g.50958  ORF Transcript_21112/g.50958 Transcript_21112/m.50958 type:complete len:129 (+) Transcript_21112:364-750(+)
MGASSNDRVKKFREKKKRTTNGINEVKAKNREYAARCRAKKEITRLEAEKEEFQMHSDSALLVAIDRKVLTYKLNLCDWNAISDVSMNEDEKRKVDIKVLRYEVKLMRKTSQKELMDTAGVLLNLKNI